MSVKRFSILLLLKNLDVADGHLFVGGDFNCTEEEQDSAGGDHFASDVHTRKAFTAFKHAHGLSEVHQPTPG